MMVKNHIRKKQQFTHQDATLLSIQGISEEPSALAFYSWVWIACLAENYVQKSDSSDGSVYVGAASTSLR